HAVQKQLMDLGVRVVTAHNLSAIRLSAVDLSCVYTETTETLDCAATVLVTMRQPVDDLWQARPNLIRIGDALGPSTIAAAVYSGHLFARELGEPNPGNVPFRRELINLSPS
ncbi:MAG: NADH:flavin oxidoreductase, partial [Kiritimatiellae bacterium]|nr:NADH:flavin oxidoreductase [Kiritimatiellia bacterium]